VLILTPAIRAASSDDASSGTGDGPRRGRGTLRTPGELPRSRLMLDRTPTGGWGSTRLGPNPPRSTDLTDEMVSLRSRRACTAAFRGTEAGRVGTVRIGLCGIGERDGGGGAGDADSRGGTGDTARICCGGAGDTDRGGGAGDTGRPYCWGIDGTGGAVVPGWAQGWLLLLLVDGPDAPRGVGRARPPGDDWGGGPLMLRGGGMGRGLGAPFRLCCAIIAMAAGDGVRAPGGNTGLDDELGECPPLDIRGWVGGAGERASAFGGGGGGISAAAASAACLLSSISRSRLRSANVLNCGPW
jgi:hypothetical protein